MTKTSQSPELLEYFRKAWMPTRVEKSYEITDIDGEIPREISGTLYRNGPSQKILPKQGYEALHLFDGDGLIHGFRIHEGRVHYVSKFVRNQSFLVEQEDGEVNQYFFGLRVDNPTTKVLMRQQHNTNVIYHGGRLFALAESAWPFEIDPRTLEPMGNQGIHGRMITRAASAHPKIDARNDQMIIHGYQPMRPFLALYTVDASRKITMADPVDIPFSTLIHDIAITENYIIVPVAPVSFSPSRFGPRGPEGAPAEWLQVKPDLNLRFAVRRREPGSPVRWFDSSGAGFIFHTANAYERDDKLIMDACTYRDPQKLLNAIAGYRSNNPIDNFYGDSIRYEFNLKTGRCTEQHSVNGRFDFPRIDERRIGYKHRYSYNLTADALIGGPKDNAIVKMDHDTNTIQTHTFGKNSFPSEAVFVPRGENAEEDDGFLLTVVYDAPLDCSHLIILDARNPEDEPIAKARLRGRVPMGFHGNFVDGMI